MPMYDYECSSCGHEMEGLYDHEVESIPCHRCGSNSPRVMSSPAFICINGYSEKNGYGARMTEIPSQYADVASGKRPCDEHGN